MADSIYSIPIYGSMLFWVHGSAYLSLFSSILSLNLRAGKMATRFKAAVSDAEEKQARATAVPAKTKACTDWGIKVWNDWAAARETTETRKPQLATSMPTPAEIDRTPLSEKNLSDDEDFAPIKKKPKITPETLKCMFGGQSTIQNCTFNIQLQK